MSDPLTPNEVRRIVDEKLATAEARTDTKFAQMLGEIRVNSAELKGELGKISTRLDAVEHSTSGLKTTVITTGIVAVALVVGILAFGQQWFGIGVTTRDIVRATVTEMSGQRPPSSIPAP